MTNDQAAAEKASTRVHRSPRYPGMPLAEALEKARLVYAVEKRAATTADVIAGHLKYKPGTGPANRVVSALRQYGLLEDFGGKNRLSELAFRLLHLSEDSPDRQILLQKAARKPLIIQELLEHYSDGLPSDATLRDYLVSEKNFNPESISFFIKVLRETTELAKIGTAGYSVDETEEDGEHDVLDDTTPLTNATGQRAAIKRPARGTQGGEQEFTFCPLGQNRGLRVLFQGDDLTQADVNDLISYLKIAKKRLPKGEAVPDSDEEEEG